MSSRIMRLALCAAGVLLFVGTAAAQLPSLSSIKGTYNVRYVGVDATVSDVPISFAGTLTFDGNGGYSVSGQGASKASTTLKFVTSGQYRVLPSGVFYMTNPFDPANDTTFSNNTTTVLYGAIGANGALLASSTDTTFCDQFVAIPQATGASAATLTGKYYVASFEYVNGDPGTIRNTFFNMTAANGSFGNATIVGAAMDIGSGANTTQTSNGVTYTVANTNGTGTLTIPTASGASTSLLSGAKTLYVSQDGGVFLAGSPTGYDFIIGIQAPSGALGSAGQGLFWESMLQYYGVGSQVDGTYSVGGSYNIVSTGDVVAHQRTNPDGFLNFDFTYNDVFKPAADGTVASSLGNYAIGAGGNMIIGSGTKGNYMVDVYAKAPTLTGTGVFLNPQGIVNAASFTPVTASVSPGEVITMFGSSLATAPAGITGLPFPTTLGGASVKVTWNNSDGSTGSADVPIYSAAPSALSVVVPYTAPSDGTLLNFQVTVAGTQSNVARVWSGWAQPGVFAQSQAGLGNGAILDLKYNLVTPNNPAKIGDTVQIFLTGLGPVTPSVNAGAAAPTNPFATTPVPPDVYIDGVQAKVIYAGLAPGLGGLYQLNVTIPTGITTGANDYIEIASYNSQGDFVADNFQIQIPISK